MGDRDMYWLIGAKLVCCGALLLVLTGVLSIGAIAAFLTGNTLPLAGAALVLAVVFVQRRRSRRHAADRQALTDASKPERAHGPSPMPDTAQPSQDRTALVLCGGGSHGALEVGFARALYEARVPQSEGKLRFDGETGRNC